MILFLGVIDDGLTLNSFTDPQVDHAEKYRKELLKEMGCSPKEPISLQEFKNYPHFHLSVFSYFEEKRGHTYYSKREDLSFLETCVQSDNVHGDKPVSMHEFLAAAHHILWNNYNFCSEKAVSLCKKMEEKSGHDIKKFTVGKSVLNWEPGTHTGQAENHMYSTIAIAQTFHT